MTPMPTLHADLGHLEMDVRLGMNGEPLQSLLMRPRLYLPTPLMVSVPMVISI
jgi:hypothetical protein